MPQLKSSNLASAEYQPESRELTVTFQNGAVYRFQQVPEFHYNNLLKANSAGGYFASRIRGTFDGVKVSE